MDWPIIMIIVVAALFILFTLMSGYVKAPPDVAYIISGLKKNPKILIGRAGIKVPFLERKDNLIVKQISVDIKTNGYVPTLDFIGVDIDAVAKIRVKTDPDGIKLAMKNFLNMHEDQIITALTDSLQGNMREIIGTVKLKELCTDRKKFGDEVQEKAQKDMNALGIEIISCNIQRIEDEKGLIVALGQDNMSQIQKDASIAKAQAERDVAIAEAEASKAANEARVLANTDIAIKQNELKIKQAELKRESDLKQAEADAAYKIQEETQRKVIETTAVEADIARQQKSVELKKQEAEVKEQELAAAIKKQADADKYRQQQMADVELYRRQKDAEAKKFEMEREAEAMRIKADAIKYQAEQDAEAIRARGIAEAEAIKAKGIAEAEATEKKAEAMSKMKEAAVLEMFFKVLPDIAANVAKPLENIDRITMYGEGNTAKLVEDITKSTTQITTGLTEGLGFDLKSVLAGALGTTVLKNVAEKKEAPAAADAAETEDFKE
ncbi:MAG: flotillin family protein [Lachnospiraceae bacterium]|nr:flotillin family protein [Lachnospiraceae bacterium]MBR4145213.1 flotillin family protein [Lachnospiraceae bacterium]MBR6474189.1 flotillin family protein [Lachnospiraceae bacterium]